MTKMASFGKTLVFRNRSRAETLENKAVLGISPPISIEFGRQTTQNMPKTRCFTP
jgi:hypothetical protein